MGAAKAPGRLERMADALAGLDPLGRVESMLPLRAAKVFGWARRILFPEWLTNRKVRPTRAGLVYVVVLILVTMAAFNTQNNMLYLVLGMMLAALVASFTISEWAIAKLHVTREAPEMVEAGRFFSVTYKIRNDKAVLPSIAARVIDPLAGAEVMAAAAWIGPGKEETARGVGVITRRGRVRFKGLRISTSAPFGWFRKEKQTTLAGEIIALPRSDFGEVHRETIATLGDQRPVFKKGRGDELFGFREYQRGDPIREIHWKTSARVGGLMVREREAEEERRLRIELMVDPARPKEDDPGRERAVLDAAALARAAIEDGWMVRVEAAGRGVDFGHGPGHLTTTLIFLALFDDPDEKAGQSLAPTEAPSVKLP